MKRFFKHDADIGLGKGVVDFEFVGEWAEAVTTRQQH